MLSQLGFPCLTTTSPKSSLEQIGRAERGQCTVVLCDIELSNTAGRGFITQVLRRDPDAFVIVMAGPAAFESVEGAFRGGAYACLPKPIVRAQLSEALDDVADQFQRRLGIRRAQKSLLNDMAAFFLKKHSRLHGKRIEAFTFEAQTVLLQKLWPRHAESLECLIAGAIQAARGDLIGVEDFPAGLNPSPLPTISGEHAGPVSMAPISMEEMRLEHIQRVLDLCDGNRVRTARMLGIGRTSLYRYLKRGPGRLTTQETKNANSAAPVGNFR